MFKLERFGRFIRSLEGIPCVKLSVCLILLPRLKVAACFSLGDPDTLLICFSVTPNLPRKKRDYSVKRKYNPEDLEKAVDAVRSGLMNSCQAARYYGVPRGTVAHRYYYQK